jgi:hypothetical protein
MNDAQQQFNLSSLATDLYEEGYIDFGVISAIIEKLNKAIAPFQNEIIHLQTQLGQSEQALVAARTRGYNEGVEAAAQLIEANEQWFEGARDHIRFAEEIRDLKE